MNGWTSIQWSLLNLWGVRISKKNKCKRSLHVQLKPTMIFILNFLLVLIFCILSYLSSLNLFLQDHFNFCSVFLVNKSRHCYKQDMLEPALPLLSLPFIASLFLSPILSSSLPPFLIFVSVPPSILPSLPFSISFV